MGVQLGAVTDGPAECIDVLQPFLPGQRIRAPSERVGFRPKRALLSAPAGVREVDGEHEVVNLIGNVIGSLRISRLPQERRPLFCTLKWKDATAEVGT